MVIEGISNIAEIIVPIAAFFSAIAGIIVLVSLFKDKIKDLFDDIYYFIFFFLTIGYTLYAIGELSWYLTYKMAENGASGTIADVYWTGGSLAILFAFIGLSRVIYNENKDPKRLLSIAGIGIVLLSLVIYYILGIKIIGGYFFGHFYPIISCIILIFSLSIMFFYHNIKHFKHGLLYLFFANIGILLGDLLFVYISSYDVSLLLSIATDISYIVAYLISGFFFIKFLLEFHGSEPQNL